MAKTPKPRKGIKPPSSRTRAARRAASPSINLDKSLTSAKPPESNERHAKIPVHHAAGVTKRKTKTKPLTRAKRLRQEKGLQRAVAVLDQMDKKFEQSAKRSKAVRDRRGAWEHVNGKLPDKPLPDENGDGPDEGQEDDWRDEGSDEEVSEGVAEMKVDDVESVKTIEIRTKESMEEDIVI